MSQNHGNKQIDQFPNAYPIEKDTITVRNNLDIGVKLSSNQCDKHYNKLENQRRY
jgi:hypothetical protein